MTILTIEPEMAVDVEIERHQLDQVVETLIQTGSFGYWALELLDGFCCPAQGKARLHLAWIR